MGKVTNTEHEQLHIPFGSEFSPDVIELPFLLQVCKEHSGNKKAIESVILNHYFVINDTEADRNRKKMAMNCRLSLQAYQILNKESQVITQLGESLYEFREDETALYSAFAKHILLNLNGLLFCQILRDFFVAGEEVTLANMRPKLSVRNLHYPSGGKHPSIMRLWLKKAGIFVKKEWRPNFEKITEVLGADNRMDALSALDNQQKAFLKALVNYGAKEPVSASEIVKLASAAYGITFPEKSLPKMVLNKLVDEGFITATKTTTGRGAKPFLVQLKDNVDASIIIPSLKQLESTLDPKLYKLMLSPIESILKNINSKNTYTSGLALEALAFKIMRLIDLEYLATRLRSNQTGGAEVDLVFQSTRLVYSRWQIQCKNTAKVSLDPVAKEVGLTHFLKSNVIMVVTTGTFSKEAVRYSNSIMRDSNLNIILFDKSDIKKVIDKPSNIVDIPKFRSTLV